MASQAPNTTDSQAPNAIASQTPDTKAPHTSPVSHAWSSIKRHAKEYHDSVNAAYTSYYRTVLPPHGPEDSSHSPASAEHPSASIEHSRRSSIDEAWHKIKKHAEDHHNSVNTAFTHYYNITATPPVQSPASSTETSPHISDEKH